MDELVKPIVHSLRAVLAPIQGQVNSELERLEKVVIIAKVTTLTKWVNSMVCVKKKNDHVRICVDPTDLNHAILRDSIDDIATRIHASNYFSTLDANIGYFQIKLTERSSFLTTFNTPFGRYRYPRMPMGAKCSSDVF